MHGASSLYVLLGSGLAKLKMLSDCSFRSCNVSLRLAKHWYMSKSIVVSIYDKNISYVFVDLSEIEKQLKNWRINQREHGCALYSWGANQWEEDLHQWVRYIEKEQTPRNEHETRSLTLGRQLRSISRLMNNMKYSVIVIVISKLLKRHSKAKRRAPAYSRALNQIRGVWLPKG